MLSCHDARTLSTAAEVRDFLADFLVQPVRWDTTIRALREEWGGEFVEVGPGNVLTGMLPFIDRTAVIQTASEILGQNQAL
jgi:malonyl CoA-acyl carrier protein transacylase